MYCRVSARGGVQILREISENFSDSKIFEVRLLIQLEGQLWLASYTIVARLMHCHLECGSRAEAKGVPHIRRSSSQHLVKDVIGSFLSRLGADTRLLQQVVRHMTTNNFKLRGGHM